MFNGSAFQNMGTADQLLHLNMKTPQSAAKGVKTVENNVKTEEPAVVSQMEMVDVTTVSVRAEEVAAPKLLNFLGYKIDLTAKIDGFKESYVKNYALTKSHNLMVARFAEFKTAALGALLSVLGVPNDEIENLQKKAVRDAIVQNESLFTENEYNDELLSIIGGSKKRMRAQNKVMAEIRGQLMIQAKNLGIENRYTRERVLELKLAQCRKILEKFVEERSNLEYQLQFVAFGVN